MLNQIKEWLVKAQEYTKFIAAFLGGVLVILTQTVGDSFIPEDWRGWVVTAIAVLTAFSVYQFPNIRTDNTVFRDNLSGL